MRITIYLVLLFFVAQVCGLLITNQHIPHVETLDDGTKVLQNATTELAFDTERPQTTSPWQTLGFIVGAVIFGTILLLILIRFKQQKVWKAWFFLAVVLCLTYSLASFIPDLIALLLAGIFAYLKIFRRNVIVHNITEVLIYGALGAIFVPMQYMTIPVALGLLIIISLYDMFAVWKSKHMVKLADFQASTNVFAGLFIPYTSQEKTKAKIHTKEKKAPAGSQKNEKTQNAILGGGDIAFPLIFAGAVMKDLVIIYPQVTGILLSLIISVTAAVSLFILFVKAQKGKFYPAMPFITLGCFAGYAIILITTSII